jgi:hypothetical protein
MFVNRHRKQAQPLMAHERIERGNTTEAFSSRQASSRKGKTAGTVPTHTRSAILSLESTSEGVDLPDGLEKAAEH